VEEGFEAYGLRIGLRAHDRALLAALTSRLPSGSSPLRGAVVDRLYSLLAPVTEKRIRRFGLAWADATQLERTHDRELVLKAVERDCKLFVAERAKRRLFVHAGVVAVDGRALILPGPSYSGKSTLVAALVRAGATYYSDEFAVLDERGRVHPWAAPLSLRQPEGDRRVAPAELGRVGEKALPVGAVLVCRYRPGARFSPRAFSPGEGTLALLANTVAARRRPRAAMKTLRRLASEARLARSLRGDADQVAPIVIDWLRRS
jgi:hypothetical protein